VLQLQQQQQQVERQQRQVDQRLRMQAAQLNRNVSDILPVHVLAAPAAAAGEAPAVSGGPAALCAMYSISCYTSCLHVQLQQQQQVERQQRQVDQRRRVQAAHLKQQRQRQQQQLLQRGRLPASQRPSFRVGQGGGLPTEHEVRCLVVLLINNGS